LVFHTVVATALHQFGLLTAAVDVGGVYAQLRAVARSEYDAEASWNNALLTTLYRAGKVHMLMDEVAEGRAAGYGSFGDVSYVERGFVLNSQTYLYFIKVGLVQSPGGCTARRS
jgi:hypothetical protein